MNTKLKIQHGNSSLEVEGTEDFVKQIYEDFKDQLNVANKTNSQTKSKNSPPKTESPGAKTKKTNNGKKSNGKGDDLNLISDLDLFPDDKISLKDFVSQYNKPTSTEKYLIYVYYLKEILNIEKITVDHIYTCIKHIGDKVPQFLSISLHNLKRNKGWIDTSDISDINYTTPGENHLDHEMEKVED